MFLRFDSPTSAIWLVSDRREALRVEPDGQGWTEHWRRVDRRRVLGLLKERPDRAETGRIARDALYSDGYHGAGRLSDEAVLEAVADRLTFGWAVEIERSVPVGGWRGEGPESARPAPVDDAIAPDEKPTGVTAAKEKDHFIIVELVGENGEPIPNELCRLTQPDGTVIERETNSQGKVEEYGIVEGDCTIEFPNLDKDAWEPYSGAAA